MLMIFYSAILTQLHLMVEALPVKSDSLTLEDVFISVKTTKRFHQTRLTPVLDTWHSLAAGHTWFFTDAEDAEVGGRVGAGHLVHTHCPPDHSRQALCCKMQAEIETFLSQSDRKWFCHVDDDNYLNVPALLSSLVRYNPDDDHYLGKISISRPLQIYDKLLKQESEFFFGTGGAGFCLSRSVVEKMLSRSESISETGDRIGLPDDVTVGYIVTVLLRVPLTQLQTFHSHLEPLRRLSPESLSEQVTLSYGQYEDGAENHVMLEDLDMEQDPTTMYTLHCRLFGDCRYLR